VVPEGCLQRAEGPVDRVSSLRCCEALPRGASQELIMKVAKERWAIVRSGRWPIGTYGAAMG